MRRQKVAVNRGASLSSPKMATRGSVPSEADDSGSIPRGFLSIDPPGDARASSKAWATLFCGAVSAASTGTSDRHKGQDGLLKSAVRKGDLETAFPQHGSVTGSDKSDNVSGQVSSLLSWSMSILLLLLSVSFSFVGLNL